MSVFTVEKLSVDFVDEKRISETSVGSVNQWEHKTNSQTISIKQFIYFLMTLILGMVMCAVKGFHIIDYNLEFLEVTVVSEKRLSGKIFKSKASML